MTSEFAKHFSSHNVGILISIVASYSLKVWHVYQLSSTSHRSVFSKVSRLLITHKSTHARR